MRRCRRNNQIEVTVSAGGDNGRVMDRDETISDGHLMDVTMDFGEELMMQGRQRLQLTAAVAGD